EEDVANTLDIHCAIDVVEEAFRRLASGQAVNVPRTRARVPGAVLHTMSAGASYMDKLGFKTYITTRHGARFHIGLYEQHSGELVALVEADLLGRLRTGAATGVATGWM